MPFEKGHTKSVGNKGGGRKSIREEFDVYKYFKHVFENPVDFEALQKKFQSKKISLRELMVLQSVKNPNLLPKILDKLLPSKQHVSGDVSGDITIKVLRE